MISDFNEKELLKMLAEDSEHAFARIFDHYRPKVQGTALKLLKNTSQAETPHASNTGRLQPV